jgi:hypothetical protein
LLKEQEKPMEINDINTFKHLYSCSLAMILCSILSGCGVFSPHRKSINTTYLSENDKNLVFNYKGGDISTNDTEEQRSTGIKMILPKGVLRTTVFSTHFSFYYPEEQFVFIKTNYSFQKLYSDTLYFCASNEMENIIDDNVPLYPEYSKLFKLKYIKNRKNFVMKTQHTEALFINIKPEILDLFRKSALSINNY